MPVVVCVVAFVAIAILPLLRASDLGGIQEYDDGVHFAAALNLVHGHVPYRDFTFLQPPGIALLLSPFALLGEWIGQPAAMALARVLVVFVGAASVAILWSIVPGSWVSRVSAAAAYMLSADVLIAHRAVLLEPFINLGVLVAIRQLLRRGPDTRRGAAQAGLVLGISMAFKVFVAVYPLAFAGWFLFRRRHRLAVVHLSCAVAGFLVVVGPFLAMAPAKTFRDVVVVQLERPPSGGLGVRGRLSDLLGLTAIIGHSAPLWLVALVLVVLGGICVVAVGRGLASVYVAVLVTSGLVFLRSPSYFPHYGAFLALPMALVVGHAIRRFEGRSFKGPSLLVGMPIAVSGLLVLLGLGAVREIGRQGPQTDIRAAMGSIAPRGTCVFSDSPSLAIAANVLTPSRTTCPQWVDGRGFALALLAGNRPHDFYPEGFQAIPRWQSAVREQLERADVILVRRDPRTLAEWSPETRSYVSDHFERVAVSSEGPSWQIWKRDA